MQIKYYVYSIIFERTRKATEAKAKKKYDPRTITIAIAPSTGTHSALSFMYKLLDIFDISI